MESFWKKVATTSLGRMILVVVVVLGGAFAYWTWGRGRIEQPIRFNHRVHVAQMECETCHVYFKEGAHSGLPDTDICMNCHSDSLTKSPEEAKLRDMVEHGKPVVFRKLFRLPSHVFYSHRRHVVIGKLECVQCHGGIANTEAPPSRPLVNISMNFCVQCHEKSKVTEDCIACHR